MAKRKPCFSRYWHALVILDNDNLRLEYIEACNRNGISAAKQLGKEVRNYVEKERCSKPADST